MELDGAGAHDGVGSSVVYFYFAIIFDDGASDEADARSLAVEFVVGHRRDDWFFGYSDDFSRIFKIV